jgi:hypothetical protein
MAIDVIFTDISKAQRTQLWNKWVFLNEALSSDNRSEVKG